MSFISEKRNIQYQLINYLMGIGTLPAECLSPN